MKQIAVFLLCSLALVACITLPPPPSLGTESDVPAAGAQEALTGFDGQTNGAVDQATFIGDHRLCSTKSRASPTDSDPCTTRSRAPGINRIGRFAWKGQQASLLSFAGDAYLNEMGITNRLLPDEVTTICDTVADPEDKPNSVAAARRAKARTQAGVAPAPAAQQEFADIDRFARFVRATKAPARDGILANTDAAREGSGLFDRVGCATCHVRNIVTVPAGTKLNGGTYTVPAALGNGLFHPFSDFLLHDLGTGDGIEIAVIEHFGRRYAHMQEQMSPTANRIRTAPLWGVRLRSRLMHDGESLTLRDAIARHGGEASDAHRRFSWLGEGDQETLLTFLRSL